MNGDFFVLACNFSGLATAGRERGKSLLGPSNSSFFISVKPTFVMVVRRRRRIKNMGVGKWVFGCPLMDGAPPHGGKEEERLKDISLVRSLPFLWLRLTLLGVVRIVRKGTKRMPRKRCENWESLRKEEDVSS